MQQLLLILIAWQQSYQPADRAFFFSLVHIRYIITGPAHIVKKLTIDEKLVKIDFMEAVRSDACRIAMDVNGMFTCEKSINKNSVNALLPSPKDYKISFHWNYLS